MIELDSSEITWGTTVSQHECILNNVEHEIPWIICKLSGSILLCLGDTVYRFEKQYVSQCQAPRHCWYIPYLMCNNQSHGHDVLTCIDFSQYFVVSDTKSFFLSKSDISSSFMYCNFFTSSYDIKSRRII